MQEAHQHCLAILRIDREFADAWFLCGVIAAHNGKLTKAVEIFPHRDHTGCCFCGVIL